MKKIILIGIIIISSLAQLSAQPQRHQQGRPESGNIIEFRTKLIINQLDIAESQQDAFKDIYAEYCGKMSTMRPNRPQRGEPRPTDEQIEAQILESFEMAEKTTALKKEYYEKFKTVLAPQQILKMYNIEREFTERINSELQNRTKGGENDRQGGGGRQHQN